MLVTMEDASTFGTENLRALKRLGMVRIARENLIVVKQQPKAAQRAK